MFTRILLPWLYEQRYETALAPIILLYLSPALSLPSSVHIPSRQINYSSPGYPHAVREKGRADHAHIQRWPTFYWREKEKIDAAAVGRSFNNKKWKPRKHFQPNFFRRNKPLKKRERKRVYKKSCGVNQPWNLLWFSSRFCLSLPFLRLQ